MKTFLPDSIMVHKWLLLLVAVLLTASSLSGCSAFSSHNAAYPMAEMADMPDLVQHFLVHHFFFTVARLFFGAGRDVRVLVLLLFSGQVGLQ